MKEEAETHLNKSLCVLRERACLNVCVYVCVCVCVCV